MSADLAAFYRRYITCCNEHRFGDLGEFVARDVSVNGEACGLAKYAAGLQAVVDEVPDFHWDVQQILRDRRSLAVRLIDTGTTRSGRAVWVQELAMYDVPDGRIAAVWGDLDRTRL
ncbi:ester cyclase [Kribbella sp. HUAS MG21]|uniref:Ester cyclase n=1 Tax=Kribbella sp. HUAS MG21 TaxID=3160966 RepID=A0AAU7T7J1_9ACTN